MIEIVRGDLFKADVEALVNPVNCDGVMGKGIALLFKKAYPENFVAYRAACKQKQVQPGKMFVFENACNPRFIINFPTKLHWRGKSRMEYIESGLQDLLQVISGNRIRSIAIPALGCGYGRLEWKAVFPKIEAALREVPDVTALVYPPQ